MKTLAQTRLYTNRGTHNQNSWKQQTLNIILYKMKEQTIVGVKKKEEEKKKKNIPWIDLKKKEKNTWQI